MAQTMMLALSSRQKLAEMKRKNDSPELPAVFFMTHQ